MPNKTNDNNIVRQFILLPLILGVVLIITGIVGIVSSQSFAKKIVTLSDTALGPTLVFAETNEDLSKLKEQIGKLNQKNNSEVKIKLVKDIKSSIKHIDRLITEQIGRSEGYVFFNYLIKWKKTWDEAKSKIDQNIIASATLDPEKLSANSDEVSSLYDDMKNISDFIQTDVKETLINTTGYAKNVFLILVITLFAGIIISIASSIFIVKKVNSLVNEIQNVRKNIQNLLNNLEQGYFTINRDGIILNGASRICKNFFDQDIEAKKIQDILSIDEKKKNSIPDWLNLTFDGVMEFSTMTDLAVKEFTKNSKLYELSYRPIYNPNAQNKLEKIICIASDKTDERQLKERSEEESAFVRLILKAVQDRHLFKNSIEEIKNLFDLSLNELNQKSPDVSALFRYLHTIKGGFATLSMLKLTKMAHSIESKLSEIRDSNKPIDNEKQNLLADVQNLNKCYHDFFEENKKTFELLLGADSVESKKEISTSKITEFAEKIKPSASKEVYMQFINDFYLDDVSLLFKQYEDLVLQLSEKLGKNAQLKISSNNIPVKSDYFFPLAYSFVHAIRNSMDHGIEFDYEREALGKPNPAILNLNFSKMLKGNKEYLVIELKDDGKGISLDKIKEKAQKLNLFTQEELEKMKDSDVLQIIFKNGFSTSDAITDTSGRGVGADALKHEVDKIGGSIFVETTRGKETKLIIEVPLPNFYT